MKKQYLYGAAAFAALALASCSQEELVSMHQDGIAYNVFTKNQTRTVDSYCQQNIPGSFNVWAQIADSEGKLYIEGDEIKNDDPNGANNVWYDATGTRYWPQGKNLNFFAHVNGGTNFNYNNGAPTFDNFKVNPTVKDQLDLMYSVNMGAINNGSPVALNFRHALSQVCFKATNNTSNLNVTIKSVSVGHLTDGGTYTFPLATTDGPIVDPGHDDVYDDPTPDRNRGTWALDENYVNEYIANVNGSEVVIKTDDTKKQDVNLTCPEENHKNGWANVMTLMPQSVAAWDPETKGTTFNGAYFLLDVVLNDDGTNGIEIYKGQVAIPVKIDWKEGYRYIYTFIFNEGTNGGWTPNPDDPQPVLAGITYTVSVDDFIPASADSATNGTDVNADPTEDTTPDTPATEYQYSYSIENDGTVLASGSETSTEESHTFTVTPVEDPTKAGYTFTGWKSSVDGTVTTTLPLTITIEKGGNVTYTAQWAENKAHKVTISGGDWAATYTDADGNVHNLPYPIFDVESPNETETFTLPSSGIVNTEDATLTFGGWYAIDENGNTTSEVLTNNTVSVKGDVTYKAAWKGPGNVSGEDNPNKDKV